MDVPREMKYVSLSLLLFFLVAQADEYADQRARLIEEIEDYAELAYASRDGEFSDAVMTALNTVARHEFVPANEKRFAYENRPLSIGYGQTISQPYIVALMTDLIAPEPDDVVLEIGTGSGYQAAVLAELVEHVYTIEIIDPLFSTATARLERLGYDNVTTRLGDGYYGWEQHGPFDAIVVTAAPTHVPPALIQQLKPGARMVIPVGGRFLTQQLLLIEKTKRGKIITRQSGAVRFVPLTGEH
jgi:protein-L-isoaspartate(D-aspartate) O-methyltransferase